jgi:hypothetical protein
VIEAIPASNDVNLPGLATTETLTRHVNLNYFSEAVSWEGEERLADADSWRITGNSDVKRLGKGCRRSGQERHVVTGTTHRGLMVESSRKHERMICLSKR